MSGVRPAPAASRAVRRGARRALVPLFGLVVAGAVLPQLAPPSGHGVDKLFHAGAFAALGVGVTVAAGGRRQALAGWGALALLAVGIEGAQALVPGRSPSLADAAASLLGVAAGAALARWTLNHPRVVAHARVGGHFRG